jgi:hypothetical protein
MYKEILRKWRIPITADMAVEWFKSVKLPSNDFLELTPMIENIRRYSDHLDQSFGKNDENFILRQLKSALRQTDQYYGIKSTNPQSLSLQFQYQYMLQNTTKAVTEAEKEQALDQTCISLTTLAKQQVTDTPKKLEAVM